MCLFFHSLNLRVIYIKSPSTEQSFNRRQHSFFFYYVHINIKRTTGHYGMIVDFVNIKNADTSVGHHVSPPPSTGDRTYTCLHSWLPELLACQWSGEPAESRGNSAIMLPEWYIPDHSDNLKPLDHVLFFKKIKSWS